MKGRYLGEKLKILVYRLTLYGKSGLRCLFLEWLLSCIHRTQYTFRNQLIDQVEQHKVASSLSDHIDSDRHDLLLECDVALVGNLPNWNRDIDVPKVR